MESLEIHPRRCIYVTPTLNCVNVDVSTKMCHIRFYSGYVIYFVYFEAGAWPRRTCEFENVAAKYLKTVILTSMGASNSEEKQCTMRQLATLFTNITNSSFFCGCFVDIWFFVVFAISV